VGPQRREETSMMKPTSSQPVESGQTNEVSQWVNSDTTPRPLDILISFEFSPEVTHDEDHVDDEDTEDVENQGSEMGQVHDPIAAEKIRRNPRKPHGLLQIWL